MAVRWDSPFVLASAGTLAVHLIALTIGDALVVTHPPQPLVEPPQIELIDVELPPPPPPPAPAAVPPPPAPAPPVAVEPPRAAPPVHAVHAEPPPAAEPPPSPAPAAPAAEPGGDPVVHIDNLAPAARGVPVAVGKPSADHVGGGGSGGGAGSGAGSGDGPPPVSVATLKTPARAIGAYANDYSKDYPAEARTLGIEGSLRVRLVVDVTGKVTARRLLGHLGHGLDELALAHAAEIQFEPARDTNDQPVVSVVIWTFTFNLPK